MKIPFWIFLFLLSCGNSNQIAPTEEAKKWVSDMNIKGVQGISCATADSDHDGYVSCDLNIDGQTKQIQCGALGAYVTTPNGCDNIPVGGCKTPKTWMP